MSEPSAAVKPAAPLVDGVAAASLGLALRVLVVVWAWARIPPAADGTFYDTIARRIADGKGYTWLWPDGTVTYAAHYPVGYPAFVAFSYRLFGATPGSAMVLAAVLGALSVLAVHRVVARGGTRRQALAAALLMAAHPGLLSYTPALMTEGVTASLVSFAILAFVRAREVSGTDRVKRALVLGLVVGLATYVRPQSLVLAPLLVLLLPARGIRQWMTRALAPALAATAVVFAMLAPWTVRNCEKMGRCALVSVNGGWNLLIGTDPEAKGSWAEVKVPEACRSEFDEAKKDSCFNREAQREIAAHPGLWLSLVPQKLAATFDYAGAGPWYLHAANPSAFTDQAKLTVAAIELVFERLVLIAGIGAVFRALRRKGTRVSRWVSWGVLASAASLLTIHAFWAVLGMSVGLSALRWGRGHPPTDSSDAPPVFGAALAVVGSTIVIHAVFFGAGRYSLVAFPAFVSLAGFAFGPAGSRVSEAEACGPFDSHAAPRAS